MENNNNKTIGAGTLQKPGTSKEGSSSNLKGGAPSLAAEGSDTVALRPGGSGTGATQKSRGSEGIPPAKRRYREKRSARRTLVKLAAIPEGQLTAEQKESVAWARIVVGSDTSVKDLGPKRARSLDEEVPGDAKRVKVTTGAQKDQKMKLFSEVLKEHALVLAVIDRGQEDGSITADKWKLVYNELNSVFMEVLRDNPGPPPSCRDAGWYQGRVKLTACSDRRSMDLYKMAMAKVGEVWQGAKLEAVSKEEIPSRPRARVWLPTKPEKPEEVIEIIQASNPHLPVKNWKIVRQEEAKGGYKLTAMLLNRESLSLLAETKGVINFGFGSITLNVYKKDEVDTQVRNQSKESVAREGDDPPETEMVTDMMVAHACSPSLDSDGENLLESPRGGDGNGDHMEVIVEKMGGETTGSGGCPEFTLPIREVEEEVRKVGHNG